MARPPPTAVTVTDLKAHALEFVARVNQTGGSLVITKRGKPVAQLVPYQARHAAKPGGLRHTLVRMGDLVSPSSEDGEWEASR